HRHASGEQVEGEVPAGDGRIAEREPAAGGASHGELAFAERDLRSRVRAFADLDRNRLQLRAAGAEVLGLALRLAHSRCAVEAGTSSSRTFASTTAMSSLAPSDNHALPICCHPPPLVRTVNHGPAPKWSPSTHIRCQMRC